MEPEKTFSASEVCMEVGITYRQLDYWARKGFLPGRDRHYGHGNPRLWTRSEIDYIKRLAKASFLKNKSLPELAKWLEEREQEHVGAS